MVDQLRMNPGRRSFRNVPGDILNFICVSLIVSGEMELSLFSQLCTYIFSLPLSSTIKKTEKAPGNVPGEILENLSSVPIDSLSSFSPHSSRI